MMDHKLAWLGMIMFLSISYEGETQDVGSEHLILHLNFDDNSLMDLSSHDHSVTNRNGTFDAGVISTGLSLNGLDAYLEIAHSPSLEIPNTMTSSFWYRHETQTTSAFYSLIEQSADEFGGHSRYGTWIFDTNRIQTCIEPDQCTNGAQTCQRCIGPPDRLEEGVWYHIASSYDGSTLKIMINGEVRAERTFTSTTGISVRSFPLTIGTDPYDNNPVFLRGTLDDIRLFDIALTESDIVDIYESSLVSTATSDLTDRQITIQPNPVTDIMYLTYTDEVEVLGVIDLLGQMILDNIDINPVSMDVSDWSSGMYILLARMGSRISTTTFLVSH